MAVVAWTLVDEIESANQDDWWMLVGTVKIRVLVCNTRKFPDQPCARRYCVRLSHRNLEYRVILFRRGMAFVAWTLVDEIESANQDDWWMLVGTVKIRVLVCNTRKFPDQPCARRYCVRLSHRNLEYRVILFRRGMAVAAWTLVDEIESANQDDWWMLVGTVKIRVLVCNTRKFPDQPCARRYCVRLSHRNLEYRVILFRRGMAVVAWTLVDEIESANQDDWWMLVGTVKIRVLVCNTRKFPDQPCARRYCVRLSHRNLEYRVILFRRGMAVVAWTLVDEIESANQDDWWMLVGTVKIRVLVCNTRKFPDQPCARRYCVRLSHRNLEYRVILFRRGMAFVAWTLVDEIEMQTRWLMDVSRHCQNQGAGLQHTKVPWPTLCKKVLCPS